MVDAAHAPGVTAQRHDAMLEAVAFAAERLLLTPDWRDAAEEVLARIGIAAGASRALIIRNHVDPDDRLLGSMQADWCAPGIEHLWGNPFLTDAPWDALPRWTASHAAGEPIIGVIASFPVQERAEFDKLSVLSIAEQPVFARGVWWGAISLDDCLEARTWGDAELQALRATATLLGAAITRQAVEEERRRAEDRWGHVVRLIPAVTYSDEITATGKVQMGFVSPQIERVLGYPPERFLEDPEFWFGLMHPEDRQRLTDAGAFSTDDLEPFDQEYRMRHADGSYRWVHDTSTVVFDRDGAIDHFLGFMTDITERKQAELDLRMADERFRSMVEQTPAVTYQEYLVDGTYDPERVETFVSPHIQRLLGFTQEESSDLGFWQRQTHPEDLASIHAESERVLAAGERTYQQDYRVFAKDGRLLWFHDESVLIFGDDDRPAMWQGVMVDITERKRAEEQLRATEERYRALVEKIPAIVYAEPMREGPGLLYLSPQVESILGYSAEEWAEGIDFWWGHIHPDDLDAVREINTLANETHETFHTEYRFRHRDGRWIWIHDEATVVHDDAGSALFWQGMLVDITSQKQAEQDLREAEQRHRTLIEHIPAVVYRESPDAAPEKFYISPQVTDLFGYTADEWTWTTDFWKDRVHPDDQTMVFEVDERSNQTFERYQMDYRLLHRDGHWVWVRDEATFVPEADGEGYWQGFLLDITERKQAEEDVRDAEQKFRTIVEQNQAIFYTQEIDPDDPSVSRTTYVAPGNTKMIGYSLQDVQDDPTLWRKIIHPEDRERVFAADADSNTGGDEAFSMEYRMIAKDGRIVWVQDEARMIKLPGKDPYWQGFLLDVTERKESEAQLERALDVERDATQRLRALDDMKNTFLQAVSHDLRTPLAAILGLAITLERGDVHLEEADARDLAHRIAANARRLDRLVTNLLDLDRLARGIVAPKLEEVDVADLVHRVLEESQLIDDARLQTDLHTVVQRVDVAKAERIVENLLANTARHTPSNASIWVGVHPEPAGVLIVVEDSGAGVPAALHDTIFEPFQQGPEAPQHSPGVGVGLTLVRRFAELHGGRAWVQDREGGGASFRVFLPAQTPSDVVPPAG